MDFILINGNLVPDNEYKSGIQWWDSSFILRQGMWFANGEVPHYHQHMLQLSALLNDLGRSIPTGFPSFEELLRSSKRLINKNKAYMGGWLTLCLSFSGNHTEYAVTLKRYHERVFPLDPAGKTGRIATCFKYSRNPLSRYAFFSERTWETELFRPENKTGIEPVFLNEKGAVTEIKGANLFCIRKNQLLTPAEETGCIVDVMREKVLEAGKIIGFDVIRSDSIFPADLNGMEEIFTVSESRGFSWLKGIGMKRYLKNNLELIWKQTVISCFPKIS